MSDERIEKIEWAAERWNCAWVAKPALEVIRELQAELRERDSQDELWRLVRVWRTRADEEYQRAEAAEARERALRDALEAIGVLPDGFCCCPANRDPLKPEADHVGECQQARAALAQQPADQPTQGERNWLRETLDEAAAEVETWGPGMRKANAEKLRATQPAQGEPELAINKQPRGEQEAASLVSPKDYANGYADALERAAQVVETQPMERGWTNHRLRQKIAAAIRNLRGDHE